MYTSTLSVKENSSMNSNYAGEVSPPCVAFEPIPLMYFVLLHATSENMIFIVVYSEKVAILMRFQCAVCASHTGRRRGCLIRLPDVVSGLVAFEQPRLARWGRVLFARGKHPLFKGGVQCQQKYCSSCRWIRVNYEQRGGDGNYWRLESAGPQLIGYRWYCGRLQLL